MTSNSAIRGAYGVYGHRLPTSALLLEGSVMYTQKGANSGSHATFYYAEVPLLLRADVARPISSARVFVNAGVAAAVRFACTRSSTWLGFDMSSCSDRTPSPFDLDLVVGGGLGGRDFEVQLRYERGLVDIDDRSGTIINRTLFLLFGIHRTVAM
jgi:hypothetical protein